MPVLLAKQGERPKLRARATRRSRVERAQNRQRQAGKTGMAEGQSPKLSAKTVDWCGQPTGQIAQAIEGTVARGSRAPGDIAVQAQKGEIDAVELPARACALEHSPFFSSGINGAKHAAPKCGPRVLAVFGRRRNKGNAMVITTKLCECCSAFRIEFNPERHPAVGT
jgi:hypothetical protein